MDTIENKDLNYWKKNAEEDYIQVPISVLRYISELEFELSRIRKKSEHFEKALKTIRDAFYSDGETDKEKIADLKAIAFDALYEVEQCIF